MPDPAPKTDEPTTPAPSPPVPVVEPVIAKLNAWKPPEGWSIVPGTAAVVPLGKDKTKLIVGATRKKAEKYPVRFTANLHPGSDQDSIQAALDESFAAYAADHPAFCKGSQVHP